MRIHYETKYLLYTHTVSSGTMLGYPMHVHPTYEIYYYIGGDAVYTIDSQEINFSANTAIVVPPNMLHGVRVHSDKPYERITLHMDPNVINVERRHLLLGMFPSQRKKYDRNEISYCLFRNVEKSGVLEVLKAFESCTDQDNDAKENITSILAEAVLSLLMLCKNTEEHSSKISEQSRTSILLNEMVTFINEHFTEDITLQFLSQKFFISPNNINRLFVMATGTTAIDYLRHRRLTYAQYLLMNNIPANQAAQLAGYKEYSAFYRAYINRFGHSPNTDRTPKEESESFKDNSDFFSITDF